MKNLKKALSLVLASAMLFGMMVVGTGAAHADVTAEHNEEAIAVVSAAGIMGANEEFNPDAKITRNEMAVVMVNMLGLDTDDFAGAAQFTDVPAWAADYVDACYANGIVSGVSATEFNGAANVTTAEAALMMMKALGYFKFTVDFENDWLLATIKQAAKINLLDGIDAAATATLTRNEVAQLALNALESKVVTGTNSSANTNISLGDAVISINGVSTYTEDNAITVNNSVVDYNGANDGKLQLIEKLYGHDYAKDTTSQAAADEYGRPAAVWTDMTDGSIIVVAADAPKYVLVAKETDTLAELIKDNGLEKVIDLNANGSVITGNENVVAGQVIELFMDKKVCTAATTYEFDAVKIDDVEECDEDIDADAIEAGAKYVVTIGNTNYYDIQFEGFNAKTFVKDAVIVYPAVNNTWVSNNYTVEIDNQYVTYFLDAAVVEADEVKVNTIKTNEYVTSDAGKYVLANDFAALDNQNLAVTGEFGLFVDANGYVVASEKIADAAAKIDDVYYVDFIDTKTSGYDNNSDVAYYAQLVAMDGTVSTIELESKDKTLANGTAYAHNAYAGKLVTISDKKWSYTANNVTTTLKADNEKFDLTLWTDADWAGETFQEKASFNGSVLKKDSTRLTFNNAAYRVTSATQFVLISKTGADLSAEVKVGGIDLTGSAAMSGYVLTETGKTVAKYVVIAANADIDEDVIFSTDLIYIKSAGTEAGDGFVMQTVYFADGSKETVKMDDGEYTNGALAAGFYSYDINSDGFYTLQDCTDTLTPAQANAGVWKDEAGILENASAVSLYEGLLTISNPTLADIDVSAAKFVDAHSTTAQGQYDKAISNLDKLIDLIDDQVITGNTIQLNVSEDGAVVIILTSATVPQPV